MENINNYHNKRRYLSLGEKKYNNQLKYIEKNVIKRLYKIPKKVKKEGGDENGCFFKGQWNCNKKSYTGY